MFGFTHGGWKYLGCAEVDTAGSYLYEPAGSVPTLHVLESQKDFTETWFAICGANLNLDDKGNVETVHAATAVLEIYLAQCRQAGHRRPDVIRALSNIRE